MDEVMVQDTTRWLGDIAKDEELMYCEYNGGAETSTNCLIMIHENND